MVRPVHAGRSRPSSCEGVGGGGCDHVMAKTVLDPIGLMFKQKCIVHFDNCDLSGLFMSIIN